MAVLYTAPAVSANVTGNSSTAYITELILANTSGSNANVTLHVVPSGGSPSAATQIIPNITISANNAKVISGLKTMIPPGGTLQGVQSVSGAVTVTASGAEVQ